MVTQGAERGRGLGGISENFGTFLACGTGCASERPARRYFRPTSPIRETRRGWLLQRGVRPTACASDCAFSAGLLLGSSKTIRTIVLIFLK
jgi:hypothetical protein